MGYTTDFKGDLEFSKELTISQRNTLEEFNEERHEPTVGEDYPGYYCQWTSNESGTALEWDGGEKFYSYVEWLNYLIKHFFEPWGIKLNGQIEWRGEEWEDNGLITVTDSKVDVYVKE